MVNSPVLVLNRSFLPVHVTNVKRALCLIYGGIAQVVDSEFRTFDFQSWAELAAMDQQGSIGLVGKTLRVPRVILLLHFDRIPKRQVKFNRYNIFLRDNNTCQYCRLRLPKSEMNLDHVIPRSQGGKSTWENVVCSCLRCNKVKGGRTPEQAHMRLLRVPRKPSWTQTLHKLVNTILYREWEPFLNPINHSYWSAELEK